MEYRIKEDHEILHEKVVSIYTPEHLNKKENTWINIGVWIQHKVEYHKKGGIYYYDIKYAKKSIELHKELNSKNTIHHDQ